MALLSVCVSGDRDRPLVAAGGGAALLQGQGAAGQQCAQDAAARRQSTGHSAAAASAAAAGGVTAVTLSVSTHLRSDPLCVERDVESGGVVLRKEVGGRLKQDLDKDFKTNSGLHTRTLMHVRKIATADLWSCPAIQLLVFECL